MSDLGIKVIAANTDGDSDAAKTHADHELSLPIAHSVDIKYAEKLAPGLANEEAKRLFSHVNLY